MVSLAHVKMDTADGHMAFASSSTEVRSGDEINLGNWGANDGLFMHVISLWPGGLPE
jgi:hypothetical protein